MVSLSLDGVRAGDLGVVNTLCIIDLPFQSGWRPEEMWRENEEKVCKCMCVCMCVYVCGTCICCEDNVDVCALRG